MRAWNSTRYRESGSRRALQALLAAALTAPVCGCMAAAPMAAPPALQPVPTNVAMSPDAPPWSSSSSGVIGAAAWSGSSSGFGTPAWAMPPSVYGSRLHVPPGESAAARVLGLTQQLEAAKSENELLTSRVRGLEADVETANKALARATSEVVESQAELANARTDLEQWKRELGVMREKLDSADKDNLSTLQTTVGLLQQLLAQEHAAGEGE